MKTKAAVLFKLNRPLKIIDLETPSLKRGQVLVQMKYSGICRSQLNEIAGFRGEDRFLPHLLGHEGSAVVLEIGPDVHKIKKNDHVVLSWIKSTGLDGGPVKYQHDKMIINAGAIATFTQYAVISENRLTKISKSVPFDVASLLGCALATGGGIVLHDLPQPDSLAVFGTGGIGSGIIVTAAYKKYSPIIAIDINQKALDLSRKIGATHMLVFNQRNLMSEVKKICPEGAIITVEASGNKLAMEQALAITAKNGLVVIAGNTKAGERISIDPFELISGKTLKGTWGGHAQPEHDFPYYVRMFQTGKLPLTKLISKRIKLADINSGLQLVTNFQHSGRILIDFTQN